MQRTHPLRNGQYFRYNEKMPQEGLAGHRIYPAEKVYLDGRGREKAVDAAEGRYILIECCNIRNDDIEFCRWIDRMVDPEKEEKLPRLILRPTMTLIMPNGNAAWVARFPEAAHDYSLAAQKSRVQDAALFAENYAYGVAMAEKYRLQPVNVFVNESGGSVAVDTSPGRPSLERHCAGWLRRYLQNHAPQLAAHAGGPECKDVYYAFRNLNGQRRELQDADDHTEPFAVEMNFVLTRKKGILPISQPTTSRTRYVLAINQPALKLSDVFPDQSPIPMMELGVREDTGLLYLANLTEEEWRCSRYGGLVIRANGEITLRRGEEITMPLMKGATLTVGVRRFETRRIRAKRENVNAPHQAQSKEEGAAPAVKAVSSAPVQKAAPVRHPFEDIYDYYSEKFPGPGGRMLAEERKSGRRVCIDVNAPEAGLLGQLREQMENPLPPENGFMGLIRIHETDGAAPFLTVREYRSGDGYVQVGSPKLRALEMDQLYAAGERMMRLINHAVSREWLPIRFIESALLVHPQTQETLFMDGAYLARPGKLPFECTPGYGAPETYRPGACADMSAVSFAAAVWLYRLLVGGYPMEGSETRARIMESGEGEAGLWQELYGEKALFAFDPDDSRNSIHGLGASFDEQIRRYDALDERIREGFRQTFCRSLHTRENERWTPGQWADVLRDCAKGG